MKPRQIVSLAPSNDTTVLEQIERLGHSARHSCRAGFCGDCRCRLVAGLIEYIDAPLGYFAENEFLPCCSIAITPIQVEVVSD